LGHLVEQHEWLGYQRGKRRLGKFWAVLRLALGFLEGRKHWGEEEEDGEEEEEEEEEVIRAEPI